eukprot:6516511-Pyramimonas_sp.AAC.1
MPQSRGFHSPRYSAFHVETLKRWGYIFEQCVSESSLKLSCFVPKAKARRGQLACPVGPPHGHATLTLGFQWHKGF